RSDAIGADPRVKSCCVDVSRGKQVIRRPQIEIRTILCEGLRGVRITYFGLVVALTTYHVAAVDGAVLILIGRPTRPKGGTPQRAGGDESVPGGVVVDGVVANQKLGFTGWSVGDRSFDNLRASVPVAIRFYNRRDTVVPE